MAGLWETMHQPDVRLATATKVLRKEAKTPKSVYFVVAFFILAIGAVLDGTASLADLGWVGLACIGAIWGIYWSRHNGMVKWTGRVEEVLPAFDMTPQEYWQNHLDSLPAYEEWAKAAQEEMGFEWQTVAEPEP